MPDVPSCGPYDRRPERPSCMLQEGYVPQPIDYRDVVVSYTSPAQVNNLLEPTILHLPSHPVLRKKSTQG